MIEITIDPVKAANIDRARVHDESNLYLRQTDWYITRYLEIGEAIPPEVLANRAAARAAISEE